MDPTTWRYVGALVALAIIIFLLWRLLREPRTGFGGGYGAGGGSGSGDSGSDNSYDEQDGTRRDQEEAERRRQETLRRQALARELLDRDKTLADYLLGQVGAAATDPWAVQLVAARLSEDNLRLLKASLDQQQIDFDLECNAERVPVSYPTADMEPVPMAGLGDMPGLLPEYHMLDDDPYFIGLAQNEFLAMRAHARVVRTKLMYLLVDISPSMEDPMSNGVPRHQWARAIVISLLLKAITGQAKYFLRMFDNNPEELIEATTPKQARDLLDVLLNHRPCGSGTNVAAAFRQAVTDIRGRGGEISQSEILVITDGTDGTAIDPTEARRLMGSDIRLHVAIIGVSAPTLQEVATSYREF
jgi:hypothetical protein